VTLSDRLQLKGRLTALDRERSEIAEQLGTLERMQAAKATYQ